MRTVASSVGRVQLSESIARAIRAERGRENLSQQELANLLGWSREKLSAVEGMRSKISIDELIAVCRALNVPLSVLAGELDYTDKETLGI